MRVGVGAVFALPEVVEGVPCWSAETAFWAVAVAALLVDVIPGWTRDGLCPDDDDAAGALLPVEALSPCGSMGRRPDRRKTCEHSSDLSPAYATSFLIPQFQRVK